jgi:histidyl-tRNA synthetase
MRDFLPLEAATRQQLIAKISQSYLARGFQAIETPVVEDLDRLTSGQGGDNEKLVFKIQKRGEDFDRALEAGTELADLGLRFDLTVPLTRYYASNHAKLPKVFKAMQIGPVFRAERPQKGRYRQFVQCDIDIIGDASLAAEAELLLASLAALKALGLGDAKIRVNHRDLLKRNISQLGISESDAMLAMITIDKLDKLGAQGVAGELGEKFGQTVAVKAAAWLEDLDAATVPEELSELFGVMGEAARSLRYDPSLVRGMGYYTGAIFEIEHPGSGSSIGGGGRYDGMVGRWLGSDVPAVGISLGFERIVDLVSTEQNAQSFQVLVYERAELPLALSLQEQFVARGVATRIEQRPKNLKALLSEMELAGASQFAILSSESSEIDSPEFKPLS